MKNIKALFKDRVTKNILLFFNENPQSIDTPKGISVWVGCDVTTAQNALNRLTNYGILINHKTASINAYSYTNDKNTLKEIERYIKKLKNARKISRR